MLQCVTEISPKFLTITWEVKIEMASGNCSSIYWRFHHLFTNLINCDNILNRQALLRLKNTNLRDFTIQFEKLLKLERFKDF